LTLRSTHYSGHEIVSFEDKGNNDPGVAVRVKKVQAEAKEQSEGL